MQRQFLFFIGILIISCAQNAVCDNDNDEQEDPAPPTWLSSQEELARFLSTDNIEGIWEFPEPPSEPIQKPIPALRFKLAERYDDRRAAILLQLARQSRAFTLKIDQSESNPRFKSTNHPRGVLQTNYDSDQSQKNTYCKVEHSQESSPLLHHYWNILHKPQIKRNYFDQSQSSNQHKYLDQSVDARNNYPFTGRRDHTIIAEDYPGQMKRFLQEVNQRRWKRPLRMDPEIQ